MLKLFQLFRATLILIPLSLLTACATIETIDHASADSPKVFSGTRMNIHAIQNNKTALMKYNVEPPRYPLLDLPGSILLDTIILPLTTSTVIFEDIVY